MDYVALSRDLVDAVESGVYIVQSKKFVYVNPFFARLTGYSPDELIGIRSFKLVLPQDRPAVRKKATRNLKSRHASSPYEYRFIKKNGETIWVMERVSPIEYMGQKAALGSFVDITPRKRLEEALAHSEETYRTMLEQMYDSYYEVDLAGNFTFVNDSVCRNLGYASEEMVGQSYRFSTPPGDVKPLLLAFSEVFRTGNPHIGFAHGILRKDGSLISVESSISLRQNAQGEIIGFRSVSRDITQRKKLEDELQKLASVVHYSSELVNLSSTDGKMIFLNAAGAGMLGIDPQNIDQFNIMQVIPDHLKEQVQSELLPALIKGGKWEGDLQYLNLKTGALTDVHAMTFTIKDPSSGAPLYFANVSLDITERKKAEDALRDSEERVRTSMENAPDGICMNDLEGNFLYGNRRCEEIIGYRREELVGQNFLGLNILPEDSQARAVEILQANINGKSTGPDELELIRKDGRRVPVEINTSVVQRGGEKVVLAFIRDITERKRAEEALKESEERYRALFDRSPDLVYVRDLKGNFIDANPASLSLLGFRREDILTLNFASLLDPTQFPRTIQILKELTETGFQKEPGEFKLKRKDGTYLYVETQESVIYRNGKPHSVQGVGRDITGRKKADEALKDSEAKYRLLADNMRDQVWLMDLNLKPSYISPSVEKSRGYTLEELTQLPPDKQLTATSFQSAMEFFSIEIPRALADPTYFARPLELEWYRKDGSTLWTENTFSQVLDENNKLFSLLGVGRDITGRKQAEAYREMGREVLQVLNEPGNLQDSIQRVLATVKTRTGLDAVGIRLQDGDDFPYFAQQGFPGDFLLTENTLVKRAADGGVCRDKDGNVSLECTCGLVISGQTDPANPYFTQGGSCWTNDQAGTPFQDTRLHPRDRCLHDGFQSVALVPIRNKDGIVGLIQLNDRRKGCFTLEPVELLEGIAAHIGEALMRKRAEEELRKAEEKYRSLVENINDVFYVLDKQGNITYVSPVVERLSKYKISDLIGKPFIPLVYPDDLPALLESFNRLVSGQLEPWEFRIVDKDGRIIWVRTSSRPLYEDGEIVGITALMTDITGRKQMEQKLEEMATHDFLTGLPNRLLLLDRFTIAAALAHRNKARLAVMSLDLDRFKTINDTLGHDAGDQVLKAVSTRLAGIIRASDTLARIGGDEFILVMMETGGMKDTAATAQKILDSFAEPLSVDGHQLHLTTSIGIAIYPADAQDLETLTKQSDAAMYYSKGHGRNQLKFFGDGDVRAGGDLKSAPLV